MANRSTSFADYYKRFRSGKTFFVTLATFIATWVGLHNALGLDADWGMLNLILSIEASIGMSLFMMISEKQDAMQRQQDDLQRKQLVYMQHLLEVAVELLDRQKKLEEESKQSS